MRVRWTVRAQPERPKTPTHPAHQLRREDLRENRAGHHHRRHHRDDDRESLLRVGVAFLGEKPRIDRDKRNRGRASGHDVVEKVGQRECCHVGVGLRPRAESVRDIGLADITDHPRQHHRPTSAAASPKTPCAGARDGRTVEVCSWAADVTRYCHSEQAQDANFLQSLPEGRIRRPSLSSESHRDGSFIDTGADSIDLSEKRPLQQAHPADDLPL